MCKNVPFHITLDDGRYEARGKSTREAILDTLEELERTYTLRVSWNSTRGVLVYGYKNDHK